jgi:hypothetical protein
MVPLSFDVGVYPVEEWYTAPNQVMETVRQGLLATGRAGAWGLSGWRKETSISTVNPFRQYISGFSAEFEIINAENKSIGKEIMVFPLGGYVVGSDNVIVPIVANQKSIIFPEVNPYDITDTLTIRISKIDGQPVEQAANKKNINIMTATSRKLPHIPIFL